MHAYRHTHTHTHKHTHRHMHTYTRTHSQCPYFITHGCSPSPLCTHPSSPKLNLKHTHTHTHACTHARTHARTHTYTHAHSMPCQASRPPSLSLFVPLRQLHYYVRPRGSEFRAVCPLIDGICSVTQTSSLQQEKAGEWEGREKVGSLGVCVLMIEGKRGIVSTCL